MHISYVCIYIYIHIIYSDVHLHRYRQYHTLYIYIYRERESDVTCCIHVYHIHMGACLAVWILGRPHAMPGNLTVCAVVNKSTKSTIPNHAHT